jgi:hypothetical protein
MRNPEKPENPENPKIEIIVVGCRDKNIFATINFNPNSVINNVPANQLLLFYFTLCAM